MFVRSGKFNKRLGSSSFLLFSAICGMAGTSVVSASGESDLAKKELNKESGSLEDLVGKGENEEVDPANLDNDASTDESEDAVDDEEDLEEDTQDEKEGKENQEKEGSDTEKVENDSSKVSDRTGRAVYLDNDKEGAQKYVYISERDKDEELEEIDELMKDVSDGSKKMLKALKILALSAAGGAAVGTGAFFATHPEAREKVKRFFSGASSKGDGASELGELVDEKELDEKTKQLEDGIDKLKDIENQLDNDENKENKENEQKSQEDSQDSDNPQPENVEDEQTSQVKDQDNTAEQKTDDVKDETQTQEAEDEQGKKDFYSFVNGKYEYRSNAVRYLFGLTKELDRCADEAATEEEKRDYISVKDRILGFLFFLKDDRTLGGPKIAAILKLIHFILLCYSLVRRCYKVYAKITKVRVKMYFQYYNKVFGETIGEKNIKDESTENKIITLNNEENNPNNKVIATPTVEDGENKDEYGLLSAFKDVGKTLVRNVLVFCAETVVPALSLVDAGMDAKEFVGGKIKEWREKEGSNELLDDTKKELGEQETYEKSGDDSSNSS